jgi:hypothetical protein
MVNNFHIKSIRRLILFYLMQGSQSPIDEHPSPTEDADLGISVAIVVMWFRRA